MAYLVAQSVKNLPVMQEITPGLIPGSERSPGREWLPTPVFLPGEFYGQKSLMGYSPWGHKELCLQICASLSHYGRLIDVAGLD